MLVIPNEVNAYAFTAPKPLLYHGNGLKIDPIVALGDEILPRRNPKTRMVEVIATPMVMVFLCILNKFRICTALVVILHRICVCLLLRASKSQYHIDVDLFKPICYVFINLCIIPNSLK